MLPVECPHCEATFRLDPDTLGKAIRCPECRQPFTATALKPPAAPTPVAADVRVFDLSTPPTGRPRARGPAA